MVKDRPIVQNLGRPKGEKPRSAARSAWFILTVVVGTLLVGALVYGLLRSRAAAFVLQNYRLETIQAGTLTRYVRSGGVLESRLERTVVAPASGAVIAWSVAEGAEVAADTVLGRLESESIGQELTSAERALESARLALEKLTLEQQLAVAQEERSLQSQILELQAAEDRLEVAEKLYEIGALAKNDLDAAGAEVVQAESLLASTQNVQAINAEVRSLARSEAQKGYDQASETLERTQDQADLLEIRSPIKGRIIQLAAKAGERVSTDAPLVTIASSTDLQVVAGIPEVSADLVKVDQLATVYVGTQRFTATVSQLSPQAERAAGGSMVVPTILSFEAMPAGLLVGGSVRVEIEVDSKEDALYLPRGPYLTTGGERYLFVVEDRVARRQEVSFGLVDNERIEVIGDLAEGQRVIVSSYQTFLTSEEIGLDPEGEIR